MDWKDVLGQLATEETDKTPADNEETPVVERRKRSGVVYSTDASYAYSDGEDEEPQTLPAAQQRLRVSMERAGRGGKTVTLVRGFQGSETDLNALAKTLKQRLGVGGSAKEGEIVIQGDVRRKVTDLLHQEGYTQAR